MWISNMERKVNRKSRNLKVTRYSRLRGLWEPKPQGCNSCEMRKITGDARPSCFLCVYVLLPHHRQGLSPAPRLSCDFPGILLKRCSWCWTQICLWMPGPELCLPKPWRQFTHHPLDNLSTRQGQWPCQYPLVSSSHSFWPSSLNKLLEPSSCHTSTSKLS